LAANEVRGKTSLNRSSDWPTSFAIATREVVDHFQACSGFVDGEAVRIVGVFVVL
jgi:hypothetical protein